MIEMIIFNHSIFVIESTAIRAGFEAANRSFVHYCSVYYLHNSFIWKPVKIISRISPIRSLSAVNLVLLRCMDILNYPSDLGV